MPTVILGAGGQLGSQLAALWPEAIPLPRSRCDLGQLETLPGVLDETEPTLLVNCAAYNQVDRAEVEPVAAWQINALAPRALAHYCRERQIPLVHISTDFVFGRDSQRSTPYSETDAPGPLSVYGTTKLAGEHFVLAASEQNLVIRTCGLYGHGGTGNFVRTMLRLAREHKSIKVVNDQTCAPTSIRDLAEAIDHLIATRATGLFHFVNSGAITWYEFAREIFSFLKLNVDLSPTTSREFAAPAQRPPYSVLNCDRYRHQTEQAIRDIKSALHEYLTELTTREQ